MAKKDKSNKPRITDGYCPGSGDDGHSLMMDGTRLRKDDPAANIYSWVEHLANCIDEFAEYKENIYNEKLLAHLLYLRDNLYSISSFCYLKGNTKDHVFPESVLDFMDVRVVELKDLIGDAPDFINRNEGYLRVLDKVRIYTRDVERAFVTWRWDDRVITKLLDILEEDAVAAQELLKNIKLMSAILNRASAWIWWEIRYEKYLYVESLEEKDREKVEKYWQGKVIPFTA